MSKNYEPDARYSRLGEAYSRTEADALFYTRDEVDALLTNYYTRDEVDALLAALGPNDPLYDDVTLHIRYTGDPEALSDISATSATITNNGVTEGTANVRYINPHLNFSTATSFLSVAHTLNVQETAWTFRARIWLNNVAGAISDIFTTRPQTATTAVNEGVGFVVQTDGRLRVFGWSAGGVYQEYIATTGAVTSNTWHEIEYSFDGTNLRMFLDGALVGTFPHTNTTWGNTSELYVGFVDIGASDRYLNGRIEELQWTSNNARNTAAFTPALSAYPTS